MAESGFTHFRFDLGEMAQRRGVGGHTVLRGFECAACLAQPPFVHPHVSYLEVEKREGERRDAAVSGVAFRVPPFRSLDFAALGMQADQGRKIFKARPARAASSRRPRASS